MKKSVINTLTLVAVFFACTTNLFAAKTYTKCDKISDIRKMEDGAYVHYTGLATTTFYTSRGLLVQDETGAIAIDSYDMSKACPDPADAGYPNLKITNIKGIFHKATNEAMTNIEIEYDEMAYEIDVKEKNVDFDITELTLSELFTDPIKYECRAIRLSQVQTNNNNLTHNGIEIPIKTNGASIPVEATFVGYYGNDGGLGFIVPEGKYITATAYQTLADLKNSQPMDYALGILDPVLVNRVVANADGTTTLYVQYYYAPWWTTYGTMIKLPNNNANIEAGDSIVGVRGIYTPLRSEGNKIYGSTITQAPNSEITILNRNNELTIGSVQELEYIQGAAAENYEAQLCASPKGTIVKHGEKYFLRVRNSMSKTVDSVYIDGADFSEYVNTEHAIIGIVDAGVVNPGYATFVLRSENDILKDNYQFNNIAELKQAGKPLAVGVTYELVNPVLVTYKYQWYNAGTQLTGIHVQDSTGGIFIFDEQDIEVNQGDSVKNFKGSCIHFAETGSQLNIAGSKTYEVVSTGHAIDTNIEEVTMADLAANRSKYSSTVVKLLSVRHGSREVSNFGQTETETYLYFGKYEMVYTVWEYELYEVSDIVGIFDDGGYANPFSFIALSQEHITKGIEINPPTKIENTKGDDVNFIYNSGNLTFSTEVDFVEIYSINGTLVSQKEVNATTMSINLNNGIYIVRAIDYDNNIISVNKLVVR